MQWIVNANQAKELISQSATILDVRNKLAWFLGHIPRAIHITWQQFYQPEQPHRGKLLENVNILVQVGVNKQTILVGE
ncbi:MAG: rhodanese-like domain-containing protein [Heteroscytonema crispum UTEX LB 1556]